jgi:phospholipid/cholesterol/gamma-HCH transport system substrate-binding protein
VFVLGGLLLFAIGLFMIGDRQMAFAKKFTIYTEFTRITGLQPGAIVRVSGAKAGEVKAIIPPDRPSERFKVRLEITEQLHPLVRSDSVATIETEGLVGGSFLNIGAGTDQAPRAPENSTIPSKEPFLIADLMQQMSDTIGKVNDAIDLLQSDVQHAVQSIGETVDNANALIDDVSDDVKTMASAGARLSDDAADIADTIRSGKGTIGRLIKDDELYRRATAVATNAERIAADAQTVVEEARKAVQQLRGKNGPVQGLTTNLRQTLDDARRSMTGFAENMEALKHNFLFRGFFRDRGYFRLADISPAAYRSGVLTNDGTRTVARVWLSSAVLFERDPENPAGERLTEEGRRRLDSAVAPFLDRLPGGVLMVEGYAQQGTRDEAYLRSRERAALACEYLIGKFHLDPVATGFIALANDSVGSPAAAPWDGVALAAFLERSTSTNGR